MDQGTVDPSGRGLAQAGKILGIISIPWTVLWLIYYAAGRRSDVPRDGRRAVPR